MQKQINKLNYSGQNIYSGIDTHKRQWTVTVMVENIPYKTFSQPSNAEALCSFLKRNFPGGIYHSAYEAGFCGFWPRFRLQELGVNSIVVNPSDIILVNIKKYKIIISQSFLRACNKIKCKRTSQNVQVIWLQVLSIHFRVYIISELFQRFKLWKSY